MVSSISPSILLTTFSSASHSGSSTDLHFPSGWRPGCASVSATSSAVAAASVEIPSGIQFPPPHASHAGSIFHPSVPLSSEVSSSHAVSLQLQFSLIRVRVVLWDSPDFCVSTATASVFRIPFSYDVMGISPIF